MLYEDAPNYDLWEVKAYVPFEALAELEESFAGAEAVLTRLMEEGPCKDLWEFQVFMREKPDQKEIERIFKKCQGGPLKEQITFVPKRDWLKERNIIPMDN